MCSFKLIQSILFNVYLHFKLAAQISLFKKVPLFRWYVARVKGQSINHGMCIINVEVFFVSSTCCTITCCYGYCSTYFTLTHWARARWFYLTTSLADFSIYSNKYQRASRFTKPRDVCTYLTTCIMVISAVYMEFKHLIFL